MAGESYTALPGVSSALNNFPKPIRSTFTVAIEPVKGTVFDMGYGGNYRVAGTTKVEGSPKLPVSRRVRLHDQLTGRLVREQWSTAGTGAYSFDNIKAGTYYVVALDHTRAYNAVIASDFAAVAM